MLLGVRMGRLGCGRMSWSKRLLNGGKGLEGEEKGWMVWS